MVKRIETLTGKTKRLIVTNTSVTKDKLAVLTTNDALVMSTVFVTHKKADFAERLGSLPHILLDTKEEFNALLGKIIVMGEIPENYVATLMKNKLMEDSDDAS